MILLSILLDSDGITSSRRPLKAGNSIGGGPYDVLAVPAYRQLGFEMFCTYLEVSPTFPIIYGASDVAPIVFIN